MTMNIKIDIDIKTFVNFFAVFAGFVLAALLISKLAAALIILFVSFFLALALNPPVTRLARLLPRNSRVVATALSYIVVLLLLGGLLVLALPPAVRQSVNFAQQVPGYIDQLQRQQGPVRNFLSQYGLQAQLDLAIENAKARSADIAKNIGTSFVGGVGMVFNGLVTIITVLVLTFLMLIEGPRWMDRFWALYLNEHKRERHRHLVRRMYRTVTAYVNGQVLVASIAATGTAVTLLVLSSFLPVPVGIIIPLAGIVMLTSMIPMIGATIGATLVTLVLLFNSPAAALIFLVYFIVYQQIENNLIQPVVQSRTVELSALGVLTAVLLGISLAGILGGLVAIPTAACLRIVLNDYLAHRQRAAETSSGNVLGKVKSVLKSVAGSK
ncbi:MAG: AI-2E family transporter [Candidatus Chaera renei]|uniref:AI-2E family transporter n=1 Tax=Candidatus Chaera renei TaxID=2506947 RepID=A0A4Q0AJ74_9BACT|nr:MAG: AI-2E family transporter [Candidatus Chaera renei]